MARYVRSNWAATVVGLRCVAFALALAPLAAGAVPGGPPFPSDGYNTLLVDADDPGIPDDVDITAIAFQQDGTYAFFRITVAGEANFASDRFYLYVDLDGDGLPDRRLHNTSTVSAATDDWSGSEWLKYSDGWAEDPDDTPDDHVYLACLLSDINGGDFSVTAAASDLPVQDVTIRDPQEDPNAEDVTGGSSNPTVVEVCDFAAVRAAEGVRLTWRAGPGAKAAGFNVRFVPRAGRSARQVNAALLPADEPAAYKLLDRQPATGVYRLEMVCLNGDRRIVGVTPAPALQADR